MTEILLGLRLLRGAGRAGLLRSALMSLGTALGVAFLAALLGVPGLLDAEAVRKGNRTAVVAEDPEHAEGLPTIAGELGSWRGEPLTRMYVDAEGNTGPAPPGLERLPQPGELFLSPRLAKMYEADPRLRATFDGSPAGIVQDAGLAAPDELIAYSGVARQSSDAGADPFTGFGVHGLAGAGVDPATVRLVSSAVALLVLVPVVVFLWVCTRLSAATRARRLAALRLIGMGEPQLRLVSAVESVAYSLPGALLGLGLFLGAEYALAGVIPGFHWFPEDYHPSLLTWLLCLVGVPFLAVLANFVGTHRAMRDPVGVRREAPARSPRMRAVVPFLLGLAILGGLLLLTALGGTPGGKTADDLLVLGILLTGGGLVIALPAITARSAALLARFSRGTASLLAARRLQHEPGNAMRVVAGLVIAVFATGVAQSVIKLAQADASPPGEHREYRLAAPAEPERLAQLPGVLGSGLLLYSPPTRSLPEGMEVPESVIPEHLGVDVFVGTCADLAVFSRTPLRGCRDDTVYRLVWESAAFTPPPRAGYRLDIPLKKETLTIDAPERTLHLTAQEATLMDSATVLLPPSALDGRAVADDAELFLASDTDTAAVQRLLDELSLVLPEADVELVGADLEAQRRAEFIGTLLYAGLAAGGLVGLCAFLIASIDRAVERRADVTALVVVGAPVRTLRLAQLLQLLLPLAIGLTLAVTTGQLAGYAYLAGGGDQALAEWHGALLTLTAGAAAVLLTSLASLPVLGKRIDASLLRRE